MVIFIGCNVDQRQRLWPGILAVLFFVGGSLNLHAATVPDPKDPYAAVEHYEVKFTVSGLVVDNENVPLPGVNVVEKGTTSGTTTDSDGKFQIEVSDANAVLVFSFIGFSPQEVSVGSQSTINVTLKPDLTSLEEVVVIGYGAQRQKEITSSVVSVKAEDFNRGNVSDPSQLLQGKVAGLTVAKVGGDPSQPFVLRLRGLSTFGANSEPLIVIDGVIGASLNAVDPNDIESMEVLKDASAGAIYGTRASSGVIIITTKSGNTNSKPVLIYNTFVSSESVSNTIDVASPEDFLKYGGQDLGYRTNWLDEVSRKAISNVHNLSVSNKVGGLSYSASLNYRNVNGVIKGTGFDQLNARVNVSQSLINDKLKLTAIVSNTNRKSDIGFAQALRYTLNFNPTAPIYVDNDPSKGFFETNVQDVYNPVAINLLNDNLAKQNTFLTNFNASFQVLEGLKLAANYSYQSSETLTGQYFNSQSLFGSGRRYNGRAVVGRNLNTPANTTELFETTGTYTGTVKDLSYTLLGGYSWNQLEFQSFSASNTNFITDKITFNNLGLGLGITKNEGTVSSRLEEARLIAFFGRLNLTFKDAYYLSASLRREGSSRFGANNRWGNFWAISGGANLAQIFNITQVDDLKLRVGYGVTGNLPTQNYAFQETLGAGSLGYINGEYTASIRPTSNPNPDLRWENKKELNAGVDFSLLEGKLEGSADYFLRNTTDLLNVVAVPSPPNLFGSSLVNLGELKTNGLELAVNYKILNRGDLGWKIGVNYASYFTELVRYNNNENTLIYQGNIGAPGLNNTYIVKVADGEEIGQLMASPFVRFDQDGRAVMRDKDGNETLNRDSKDFVVGGHALPDFTMGLNNTFTYKNFDLNIFLRGVFGHSLANIQRAYFEHPGNTGTGNIVITDEFNADDKETAAWHTGYIEKASFVRLDNATLGYTFKLKESSIVGGLRAFVTGQNLFTITKYTGSDPEVRYYDSGPITEGNSGNVYGYNANILAPGIDNRVSYFPTRTVTVGVNISF